MAQPLTKKDQSGTLYTRPKTIEAAIDEAMKQNLDTLIEHARIAKLSVPGFLPLECLVHLIRAARRSGDQTTMSGLMPVLLGRCEAILRTKIQGDCVANAEDLREEILGEFAVLFAEDGTPGTSNALDFFECRFNSAFLTFRLPFIERERARTIPLVYAPPQAGSSDDITDEEFFVQLSDAFHRPPDQVDRVLQNTLAKAVDALPPDQRKAVVLCYFYEYPEESDDPTVTTAASLCGVTGRTIRNRLARAIKTLSKLFNKDGEKRL